MGYGYSTGVHFDYTYLLVIAGMIICLIASYMMKKAYRQYSTVMTHSGITGAQAAAIILRQNMISDVSIGQIAGTLTDHYAPSSKKLNLSQGVYGSSSISAVAVAAHECGHALQHKYGYAPLALRSVAVPVANIGNTLSWPLIIIGLIFGLTPIAWVGVILFGVVLLFQLITLPVEINASRRALQVLGEYNIMTADELPMAKKVLTAAALTYVSSALASILQLIRLLSIMNRRSN